ncbi:type II toxin-antitoxin system Phd/YefM family antitoxin [Enterococcus pallens]|uniref:Antitoxin n=1 Tax=Enterococcus pallens ATCC BAA-351 TaxID=1158607 RepID=R2T5B0_9ENTE|nr:type II toxin-antitoxin system prevent-host-death family antitoxin [Enterococcus pallens]EOH95419.1 prevent-host-death family protein [Enterococcus pallens ATCC BAA-351]EOU21444.1 hypothetical protein I588_02291 [Enterococcus pallens ATCC BAA-351]OJG76654.1 prevent-host-death family protein [Enterococcus pallens]
MEVISPTNARKDLYGIIKRVVSDNQPIEIASVKGERESVVVISKSDWDALQETIYLQNTGVLDRIKHYEEEEVEDLGEIDWDTL